MAATLLLLATVKWRCTDVTIGNMWMLSADVMGKLPMCRSLGVLGSGLELGLVIALALVLGLGFIDSISCSSSILVQVLTSSMYTLVE